MEQSVSQRRVFLKNKNYFCIICIHTHTSGGKQRWRRQFQTDVFAPACPPTLKKKSK